MYYTYRITNIKENKHYYGYRNSKDKHPKEDLGIIYFSSSSDKEFIKEQKEKPYNFKYKVIYSTILEEKAQNLEIRLHKKFMVGTSESFYNRATHTHISLIDASEMSRKSCQTSIDNILDNGLSIKEQQTKDALKTGKNNIIDGKNSYQRAAHKIYEDRDEEYRIDKSLKGAQTCKDNNIYEERGINHSEYQNEILESGLTRAQETGIKVSETRKRKFESGELMGMKADKNPAAVKTNIYSKDNSLMFECNGNFEKICIENNLPRSFLKRTRKSDEIVRFKKTKGMTLDFFNKHKEFEGWYARQL